MMFNIRRQKLRKKKEKKKRTQKKRKGGKQGASLNLVENNQERIGGKNSLCIFFIELTCVYIQEG